MSKGRAWLAVLAGLLILCQAGLLLAAENWPLLKHKRLGQGQVPVPSVIGLSEAEARAELGKTGLRGRVHLERGGCQDPASAGQVLRQRPEPGQELTPNSWVDITVCPALSLGRRVEVPNLYGQEEAQARALLKAAGLHIRVVKRVKCERPGSQGRVICQSPPAGEQARLGQRVKVRVCREH